MKTVIAILAGLLVLVGCAKAPHTVSVAAPAPITVTAPAPVQHAGVQLGTVTHNADIQVTAVFGATPQFVLTLPAIVFDGTPVLIDFNLEYVNEIPDTTQVSNGIGFNLYEDGVLLDRLGLFGDHLANQAPMFAPLSLSDQLDGTRTPTAGSHVFAVAVWKWQPHADGYLRGGDDVGTNGEQRPIRLSVSYV